VERGLLGRSGVSVESGPVGGGDSRLG
jgi:hypothetical protein